jgi:hypothetical protein
MRWPGWHLSLFLPYEVISIKISLHSTSDLIIENEMGNDIGHVHDPLSTSPLPRHFLQPHTVAHCHLIHAPKFAIKKQGPTKRIIDDSIILKALCCISGCISTRSFQRLNILGQESLSSRAADVSQNPSTSGWVLLRPKSRPHIDSACPPPYYDRLPTASP